MKSLLIITISLMTFSTFAADGSSGCGPGWYIFKKNSIVSSLFRATTNGILFPVTTLGMTLGTSNCSKHSIVKTEQKSLHFITHNYHEVKSEVSKGSGDFISALGKTIGCKSNDLEYFNEALQKKYKTIFKDKASNEDVLRETYKVILTDPVLIQSCSLS